MPRARVGASSSWAGAAQKPLTLPNGERRSFLDDGDRVVLRGWSGRGAERVGFGELEGTVASAPEGG